MLTAKLRRQPLSDPLTVEFARNPYTISECGKYEIIGDGYIKRRKGSERVPGIWPEVWNIMSTEQRTAMRQSWEAYQEQLTTSAVAGGGDASAVSDTLV